MTSLRLRPPFSRHYAHAVGATLLIASGEIHGYLYFAEGYHAIPNIGPLFAAQSVAAIALGLVLVGPSRRVLRLAGAGLALSSAAGLLMSSAVSLFGFHDSLTAPGALFALIVEFLAGGLLLF